MEIELFFFESAAFGITRSTQPTIKFFICD